MNGLDTFSDLPYPSAGILALSLSHPHTSVPMRTSEHISLDLHHDAVVFRIPRYSRRQPYDGRVACSKETIHSAILLLNIWRRREGEDGPRILAAVRSFARDAARADVYEDLPVLNSSMMMAGRHPHIGQLFERLDIGEEVLIEADKDSSRVLRELEQRGLILDPGITTAGLIVMAGFLPMKWSVRTPEGERIYRQIRIVAPAWRLEIDRLNTPDGGRIDWDFEFRGIAFVRRVLARLAEEYLQAEAGNLAAIGRPSLRPPRELSLNEDHPDDVE